MFSIEELQLLSKALWESVKQDLKLFSSIQTFVKNLAEFDYSERPDINELIFYADKIYSFFNLYNNHTIQPKLIASNNATAKSIYKLSHGLLDISDEQLINEIETLKAKSQPKSQSKGEGQIFIGHGRSQLWARLQVYLQDELKLQTLSFETESHTSEAIINILDDLLNKASYAILILTAEDETNKGRIRARQNVIHEVGLFQGRLGFNKVILLKQDETEEFTNIAGLQYIPFTGDNIEQTFYLLQRALRKSCLI